MTNSVAILGATGFVGSAIRERFPSADLYSSANLEDISGRCYDTVYCACVPAVKWLANKDPEADKAAIEGIQRNIDAIGRCGRFVLISTIDVHGRDRGVRGESDAGSPPCDAYGAHRLGFEAWATSRFPDAFVVRLPALFGLGIKKNAVYDLLHGNRLEHVPVDSCFQWYDLSWLNGDIDYCFENDARVANLYPEPLSTRTLILSAFPEHSGLLARPPSPPSIEYRHGTDHPRFRRSSLHVLEAVHRFVCLHRAVSAPLTSERLAASALGWMGSPPEHAAFLLRRYGIHQVELVPSLLVDGFDTAPEEAVVQAVDRLKNLGLEPVSWQSVLFGVPGDLSSNRRQALERLKRLDAVAKATGVRTVVFGSPTFRTNATADDLASFLREAADNCPGLDLCLEPNATAYGCRIATNVREASLVAGRAGVYVNLDTGNAIMEDDLGWDGLDPSLVRHAQVSAPFLASIDADTAKVAERAAGRLLLAPRVVLETKDDGSALAASLRAFVTAMHRPLRVAYLVCGHFRDPDAPRYWEEFRRELPSADVFVHAWSDLGVRSQTGQWIAVTDESKERAAAAIERAIRAISPVRFAVEDLQAELDDPRNSLKKPGAKLYYSNERTLNSVTGDFTANIATQLLSVKRCFELADAHAADSGFKYDMIVRCRADRIPLVSRFARDAALCRETLTDGVLFFNMHSHRHPGGGGGCVACDEERLHGRARRHSEHANDLCDVHYYGNHASMAKACSLYDSLHGLVDRFHDHNRDVLSRRPGLAGHVVYCPASGIHRVTDAIVMETAIKCFYPERLLREHLKDLACLSDVDNVKTKKKDKLIPRKLLIDRVDGK